MVSAELEPVTRTFGTTVVKDDALAAYATHATQQQILACLASHVGPNVLPSKCWLKVCQRSKRTTLSCNNVRTLSWGFQTQLRVLKKCYIQYKVMNHDFQIYLDVRCHLYTTVSASNYVSLFLHLQFW
jgi:hypothetical protein